jgi:cystathionine beta-lyase/cystathionine gamma-synthase
MLSAQIMFTEELTGCYEQVIKNFGLEFSYVDTSNFDELQKSIKPNTKLIYVETPTNRC